MIRALEVVADGLGGGLVVSIVRSKLSIGKFEEDSPPLRTERRERDGVGDAVGARARTMNLRPPATPCKSRGRMLLSSSDKYIS
jgi:hypothetical protein